MISGGLQESGAAVDALRAQVARQLEEVASEARASIDQLDATLVDTRAALGKVGAHDLAQPLQPRNLTWPALASARFTHQPLHRCSWLCGSA